MLAGDLSLLNSLENTPFLAACIYTPLAIKRSTRDLRSACKSGVHESP